MSALLIDLPADDVIEPRSWVHVAPAARPSGTPTAPRSPQARPVPPRTPGGRPGGVRAPSFRAAPGAELRATGGTLHLTRRGLAVVMGFFTALMATAATVVVTSFLSVSNDPPVSSPVAAVQPY